MDNKLISNLRPMIEDLERLFAHQESILHHRVNEILAQRSGNINEIDHLMEGLFNNMFYFCGIDNFQRLKEYLAALNPYSADFYQREFEEWSERPHGIGAKTAVGYGYFKKNA